MLPLLDTFRTLNWRQIALDLKFMMGKTSSDIVG